MADSLQYKTIRGTIWTAISKFGTMFLSFVSNMVLARMLTPDDFGCIGMLAIFIVIANTFVDSGLGSAIIQKKNITNTDLSTVFFFNLTLSTILYCLLFLFAPFIAEFYRIPLLSDVLRVEGLVLIINSFAVVQTAQLRKQMEFNKIAYSSIGATVISVSFAIITAFIGWNIWALVFQQIIYAITYVIIVWIMSHWKPIFTFSTESFKQLFGFGSYLFLSNLINNIGNNIQGLIIGRAFNAGVLGYYSQARRLEEVASTSISSIIDQVSYPALAEKQDDRIGIVYVIRKMIKFTAFVSFPLMVFLAISSDIIIPLCYGSQWMQSVPYFRILCIAGMAICLQGINYNAVAAIGESDSIFRWTIIKRLIALVLLIVGAYWGIYGLLIGIGLGSYAILICNALQVQRFLRYTLWMQAKDLLAISCLTIVCGILVWSLIPVLHMNDILNLITRFGLFAISYFGIAYLFKIEPINDLFGIVKQLIERKHQAI